MPFRMFTTITFLTGLELARLADFPSDILEESRRVAERLAALRKRQEEESEGTQIAIRRKALLRVRRRKLVSVIEMRWLK